MKFLLPILLPLTMATEASASIPTGTQFGPWHVTSITSLSGADGDDASVSLSQERGCSPEGYYGCSRLEIRWIQKSDVIVSIHVNDCHGEDEDFDEDFSVPVNRWVKTRNIAEEKATQMFKTWLARAGSKCDRTSRAGSFSMRRLNDALRDFSERLAYLSQ